MYTGREWDSVLAQYHYRARIYDANLGRFASRDPIGYEGGSACFYELVSSSPLLHVDPQGLSIPIGSTCASSTTTTSYEVVCLYDSVGWFGTTRKRVSHPLPKGGDPIAICNGNGFAGYQMWETTVTTTTSRTPCMPTLATTCNNNVLPGPGIIRSVAVVGVSLTAYYVGVSVNYPKISKRRVPYPWPKKKPGTEAGPSGGPPPPDQPPLRWPPCPDGQCLCCDLLTGGFGNNGSIDDITCKCKDPAECWSGFPYSVCVDPLRQQPGKLPIEDPNFPKSRY